MVAVEKLFGIKKPVIITHLDQHHSVLAHDTWLARGLSSTNFDAFSTKQNLSRCCQVGLTCLQWVFLHAVPVGLRRVLRRALRRCRWSWLCGQRPPLSPLHWKGVHIELLSFFWSAILRAAGDALDVAVAVTTSQGASFFISFYFSV